MSQEACSTSGLEIGLLADRYSAQTHIQSYSGKKEGIAAKQKDLCILQKILKFSQRTPYAHSEYGVELKIVRFLRWKKPKLFFV